MTYANNFVFLYKNAHITPSFMIFRRIMNGSITGFVFSCTSGSVVEFVVVDREGGGGA